ncbi:MAG: hypothetical protein ACRDUV_25080 [Pseudonocardiaceae bacterium]
MSGPATGPAGIDPCPYCGTTTGVQSITGASPRVRAWSCACRTDWAITVVDPRLFLDQLTATVELAVARSVLREIITLADQVLGLTDDQLHARLTALAACAASRSHAPSRSPAGRWSSNAPLNLLPAAGRPSTKKGGMVKMDG